jgi:hypothetical protein
MTHWGWYWKIKKKHKPKSLCPNYFCLDSFSLFKIKGSFEACLNKVALEMPPYKLKATLLYDRYSVEYAGGKYDIPIERQSCNYGGFRYFLHCPKCNQRMRMLYCKDGFFSCRKCLNLGYYKQRLIASERCLLMGVEVKDSVKIRGGSIEQNTKPKRMRRTTFEAKKTRYRMYEDKYEQACIKELLEWYPDRRDEILRLV